MIRFRSSSVTAIAALSGIALVATIACSDSSHANDSPPDAAARAAALAAMSRDTSAEARAVAPDTVVLGRASTAPTRSLSTPDTTGIPDLDVLRVLMDHHLGLIALAHAAAQRVDASHDVRDDARALAARQSAELDTLQSISERQLREHRTPTALPQDRGLNARTLGEAGPEFDRAFREAVIEYHRRGAEVMDRYLPRLQLVRLKVLLPTVRQSESQEIVELQRKLSAR